MSREAITDQDRALLSYDEAVEAYNSQALSLGEWFLHSTTVDESVVKFGQLLKGDYYKDAIVERLKQKKSEWNSSRTKSFNCHFLRALERHAPALCREVISDAHSMKFLEDDEVTLYRADARDYSTIFREGFKPWYPKEEVRYRCDYGKQYSHGLGISTTKSKAFAYDWGGSVYKLCFKNGALRDPRLEAIDIVETGKLRQGGVWSEGVRYNVEEVNFISAIPARFIESVVTIFGRTIVNPTYTGQFTPVLPAEPGISVGAGSGVGSEGCAETGKYSVGTKVMITGYDFDFQCCKGQKGQAHLVFDKDEHAGAFIVKEDLRSERNPTQLKALDPVRYRGLFAVRASKPVYEALCGKHASLPQYDDLPDAPEYK